MPMTTSISIHRRSCIRSTLLHYLIHVVSHNRLMDNQSGFENETSRSARRKRKDFLSPMISSASLECDSMIGHPDAVPQGFVYS